MRIRGRYLLGILAGPLARSLLVPRAVGLVGLRDFRYQGVVRVGVREERADRQEHLGDGEGGRPLIAQNVQTYRAVRVDVGVVDARREGDFRRFEGVVGREVNRKEEDAAAVGGVGLFRGKGKEK